MKTMTSKNSNSLLKVLSCRACLATDVKLFSIHEDHLAETFALITGIPVLISDGLPQHLCTFCCTLLQKCSSFRAKCLRAQHCLTTRVPFHELTTDYIRTIDRLSHQLLLNLTLKKLDTTDYREDLQVEQIKKEEDDLTSMFLSDDLKLEFEIKDRLNETVDNFSDDNTEQIFVATNPVVVKKERKVRKRKKETKVVKRQIKKRLSDNDYLPDFDFATFENDYSVEIITLTKEQQLEEIAARKSSDNYRFAPHRCEECGKGFQAEDAFNNHVVRHSPSMGAHACEICRVRFKRLSRRQEHQDLHRLKILCKECGFVSRNRYQAKKHYEWHTGKVHVCKHCGASFTKSSTYLSHVRLQHPAMNAACGVCGETFVGRLGLMQHKSRAHQQIAPTKPESKCPSCGAQFESLEALDRHTHAKVDGACNTDLRPCSSCGESFASGDLLQTHMKESHETEQFQCLECPSRLRFASAASLEVHRQRVHLNVRWRRAPRRAAPAPAPAAAPAAAAPRRPRAAGQAICEVCGKACEWCRCMSRRQSNAALAYHQRGHTGERPFRCSQCPKCFTMPQALIIHQLVHSDERPYACAVCPKAFKQKVGLQLHSRVHTGERPYKCSSCDSAFKQGPHLRTHVKLMHGARADPRRKHV